MSESFGRRILRFITVFGFLRAMEAIAAIATMVLSSAASAMLNHKEGWSIGTEAGGALLVTQGYYLNFQYLAFSALAFIIAELTGRLDHRASIVRANLGAFILHSAVFVAIGSRVGLGLFWIVWLAVVMVNWLAPRALEYTPAKRFLSR